MALAGTRCRMIAPGCQRTGAIAPPGLLAADWRGWFEARRPQILARHRGIGRRGRWAVLVAAVVLAAIGRRVVASSCAAGRGVLASDLKCCAGRPGRTGDRSMAVRPPALVLPAATVLVMRLGSAARGWRLRSSRIGRDYSAAATSRRVHHAPSSADGWFYLGANRLLTDADAEAQTAHSESHLLGAVLASELSGCATAEREPARRIRKCGSRASDASGR